MKKILLASVLSLATATSTLADTKHGFYLGIGLANLIGHHNANVSTVSPGNATITDTYGFSKSTIGGDLLIGYMVMLNNLNLGIEVDYMFGNINKTNGKNTGEGTGIAQTIKADSTGGAWGGAVRVGYQCIDRILPYIRLGLENRRFKLFHNTLNQATEISTSARKTAFVPGVGMDFKLNKNVILGLEYRYAIYSSITKSGNNTPGNSTVTYKLTPRVSTAMISLKYQF